MNCSTLSNDFQKRLVSKSMYLQSRPATLLKNRLWHRYFPVNFTKFFRATLLQNTPGRLLLKKDFLNWHLIKVSKLLVFVLISFFHYFKYYGQNIFSRITVLYLIAKVERKEKTFYLKHEIILCQKKREAKCFRLRR